MIYARIKVLTVLVAIATLFVPLVTAQNQWSWPEEPENLKVLPAHTKGSELGRVMRGFASSLGVRCQHCHVGNGPDLSTFDFVSDEKSTKLKARVMIEMVMAIQKDHLSKLTALESEPQVRVELTCMTCHRGQPRPIMLDDMLAETIEDEGIDAAIAQYHELRDEHYGGFAYDFGPGTLTGLGESLGNDGNYEIAIQILNLEIEVNGESSSIYYTLGGVQMQAELVEDAISSLEKGLELAQDGFKPFFQRRLDRLRN